MSSSFHLGSVLGRFEEVYSDEEKKLCHSIAMFLKNRWDKGRPTRDDMEFFVRAGASLYELAKQLHSLAPLSRRAVPKTAEEWLEIVTGHRFAYYTDPNLVRNVLDVHVSEPSNDGTFDVRVGLPRLGPTAKELEQAHGAGDGAGCERGLPDDIDVEGRTVDGGGAGDRGGEPDEDEEEDGGAVPVPLGGPEKPPGEGD